MRNSGLLLEVIITPPQAIADRLRSEGKPLPSIKVPALIDTGATLTCICPKIVEHLGLLPNDVGTMRTAGGTVQQLLYDIGIVLPITQPNIIPVQSPSVESLDEETCKVLLGRDVLSLCSLFYNGRDGSFTLHF